MATIVSIFNQLFFACKFCNQVFTNFQLFKTHHDSHFVQENFAMRRLSHMSSQRVLHQHQPNFPRPMLMHGTDGNFAGNRAFQEPQQQQALLISQPRVNQFSNPSLQVVASQPPMPSLRNNVNVTNMTSSVAPPILQMNDEIEVSSIDGTRAYIKQLDKPIDNNVCAPSASINDEIMNLELGL
ncbi:putative transcription factor C2H2 family [Medicago truncatula]|uniref:Putative transcription factor C2H2 family n=1 Tax=Medicago truncatula TaxID=3880 RepID=G7JTS8_MEDTR|nr:hypothetical protein MTR_4g063510 [Medicago truncatula]RHN60931.1 putative transcription factor C2H2 family [Medicago truncatula]